MEGIRESTPFPSRAWNASFGAVDLISPTSLVFFSANCDLSLSPLLIASSQTANKTKMVEAVPFGIATHLLVKLGSSTFQELGLIYGVDKELTKLESTLSTIRAVLSDAEEKQETSHLVQEWMRKLKDVVYRADNVFDVFETKANDGKDQLLLLQVRGFFSPSNHLAFRHKMGREIKEIRESLDEIAADISKFNFRAGSVTVYADIGLQNGYEKEETHSFVLPSTVIGRDKDKEEMVRSLMWECDRENVSIAAIVGIGGLGKTTLAKMLYNDERVVSYFQLKMWVWAYGNFDVRSIASKILSTGTADELQEPNFLIFEMAAEKNGYGGIADSASKEIGWESKISGNNS